MSTSCLELLIVVKLLVRVYDYSSAQSTHLSPLRFNVIRRGCSRSLLEIVAPCTHSWTVLGWSTTRESPSGEEGEGCTICRKQISFNAIYMGPLHF